MSDISISITSSLAEDILRRSIIWESQGTRGGRFDLTPERALTIVGVIVEARRKAVLTLPEDLELLEAFRQVAFQISLALRRERWDRDAKKLAPEWGKLRDALTQTIREIKDHPLIRLARVMK